MPEPADAPRSATLVGAWTLVSAAATTPGGKRHETPFGSQPSGMLIYSHDGRMSAMISNGDRTPLSVPDRITAPIGERADAFSTYFAYGGRYSFDGHRVTHHLEISSLENWVGTDFVREVRIDGDRMTLTAPPMNVAGRVQTTELVWQRVRR